MKRAILLRILFISFFIFSRASAAPTTPQFIRRLFSPDDHPKTELIKYINAAKKTIYVAMYTYTDKDITQALIHAKNRGVTVRMGIDRATLSYEQISVLFASKIPIFVFGEIKKNAAGKQVHSYGPIMHNKFALFDNNILWTGSFNWTLQANNKNQENVLILDRKGIPKENKALLNNFEEILKDYKKQFNIVEKRSQKLIEKHLQKKISTRNITFPDEQTPPDEDSLDDDECCCGLFNWCFRN